MHSRTKTVTNVSSRIFLDKPRPSDFSAYNPNTSVDQADPEVLAYFDAMARVDGCAEIESAKSAIADIIRSHGATDKEVRRFMEHIGYRVAGAVRCGIENWAGAQARSETEATDIAPERVAA